MLSFFLETFSGNSVRRYSTYWYVFKLLHIAKLNGRLCGAKRPHSVSEQPNFYQSLQSNPYNDSSHPRDGEYIILISEEENVKSLNSIDVIFHKNQRVRQAWKSYMDEADKPSSNPLQLNDRYIKLLEEMALACGY